ncbi:MAG: ATP-binding protein [Clostridiales bacterium]|nr:ATP-binding protein [Clostridiales bacterium]
MYYTVLGIYMAACVVLGMALLAILRMESNEGQQCMLVYMLCSLVQNVGYVFEMTADTAEAALVAIRMEYLGSTFIMLFLCEYVYFFFRVEKPKYLFRVLMAVDVVLLVMMWLDERLHCFYRATDWTVGAQHSFFVMHYAVGFYVWICVAFFVPLVILVYQVLRAAMARGNAYVRRQAISLASIAWIPILACVIYIILQKTQYDFTPITVGIAILAVTFILFRNTTENISQLTVGKMIDRLTEVVIIADRTGTIVDLNARAAELFGDIRSHGIGESFEKIKRLDPDELNRAFEIKGRMFENRVEAVCARDGDVIGYLIMMFDTTQLHEAMAELTVQKERAEEANEAKSAFLSNMSHEIRTPMNSIVGITEILLGREDDREKQTYLRNIKTSGDALLSIINDILDFSKIEKGDIQMQRQEYGIMSIIQDLGMMFLNRIGEKPIEMIFDIDKNLPAKVIGDGSRVRQVIINIVNNAIKYTNSGYVKLEIRSKELPQGGYDLLCSVSDTGIGIKKEDMDKLFETFTRVDMEHNRTKEGTGLGLSIAKNLVTQMGGQIRVESIYGMGSKFIFDVIQEATQDKSPAVALEGQEGKKVSADIKNSIVLDTLTGLLADFEMTYVPKPGPREGIDYFFVDAEEFEDNGARVLDMRSRGARIFVLVNPMKDNLDVGDATVLVKPLYSLSFANAIMGVSDDDRFDFNRTVAFTAPQARVLIVDDNEMNLKVAKGLLEPIHMQVETASNGEEAISKIRNGEPYDLVLMDHMMPVMDGVEATRILRESDDEYCRTVPIIALTANAIVGVKEEFLAAGMNGMVTKPIDLRDLYRTVREFLPPGLVHEGEPEDPDGGSADSKAAAETAKIDVGGDDKIPATGADAAAQIEIPGIDMEKAMAFCGNTEFLREMFGDYCSNMAEKSELIEKFLAEEDFKNYTVEVHGLKGTSRLIGAMKLGDEFAELEQYGKDEDLPKMREMTPEVLGDYRAECEAIASRENTGN